MSLLTLEKVGLAYQSQTVVDDVSLSLEDGEIACLLGPSGCGKTTLLRAIAGFKSLNNGTIESAGKILSSKTQVVPPEKRRIGMVFQDFALFPHLTVGDNICFGIRQQQRVEKRQRLQALLALIGLESSEHKYPHELSGGQQQRVALARAIAPKPHLLLLDEPFSSMDVELRDSLAKEVRGILKQEKVTAIMVTHDQHEAFSMADRIGVLNEGKLLQWGTAEQLYHAPNGDFIAHFVGFSDFLTGKVNGSQVETALGCFPYRPVDNGLLADLEGQSVKVLIRPEYIQIAEDSRITAKLVSRAFRGGYYRYLLRLQGGEEIQALLPSLANYQLGDVVTIAVSIDRVSIFKNG